jgi:hypothetical protein
MGYPFSCRFPRNLVKRGERLKQTAWRIALPGYQEELVTPLVPLSLG